jgi:hypothetical protein
MRVDAQRHLQVRGYVGLRLLGQTQVWTPYAGPLRPDCGLAPGALR